MVIMCLEGGKMTNLLDLELIKIHELLKEGKIKPIDLVEECAQRIAASDLNAFINLDFEGARAQARALENKKVDNILFGIPIAIKDNIVTKGLATTCASKVLADYVSPFDAKVIEKLKEKNMIIVGKTNMDEFAMGGTGETSYFGPTKNPLNKAMSPGGSSSGSAAAVAGGLVPLALGSDTGGSIREPAAFCGLVGLNPTYGRVSRYGLIAFGSSLDQIGPLSRRVIENAHLFAAINGECQNDTTTASEKPFVVSDIENGKKYRIAVPNFCLTKVINADVVSVFLACLDKIKAAGHQVDFVELPYMKYAIPLYQVIALAEASSNLARFDGIKYGYQASQYDNYDDYVTKTRTIGFGTEVKRRIMVGTYLLSSENVDVYYKKALQVRRELSDEIRLAFQQYDLIVTPATVSTSLILGKDRNPNEIFLQDLLAIPFSMSGHPSLVMPVDKVDNNPIGLQIAGRYYDEKTIYAFALELEKNVRGDESV